MSRRKYIWISLIALILVIILYMGNWYHEPQNVYERNKEVLNNIAEKYLEDGNLQYPEIDEILQTNVWNGDNPILEFLTYGSGIASASKYSGFYFSVNGIPAAYQGIDIKLELKDDGWWEWHDEGDNGGRTKLIEGNWYVFEAHF